MTELEIKARIYDLMILIEQAKAEINAMQTKLQELNNEGADN